ncbi:hypothetical protein F5148DRAFT_1223760 [Russula earlei]|uniref:Uncharacterized protein n=1 Tax=Russula earlei TaxID=71964 RepID=A0ACC0U0U2_9AGAM|nr:hypothetical protein F5148DRAFT_1223760 [Russula earlei]
MNVEPLGDISAHRYAYESDDEDQLNPLSRRTPHGNARCSIQGEPPPRDYVETIIIASGEAGKAWAQGIQLGEQRAVVVMDDIAVGFVFLVSWSNAVIIVSETSETLPTWAMRPYADAILGFYNPKRLLLLDSYPAPTYISSEPLETHRAPTRYLCTRGKTVPGLPLMPFLPPNLIQSTSAAFTSVAGLPRSQTEAILLLLPSQYIPMPRGNNISLSSNTSEGSKSSVWPETMMRQVHGCIVDHSGIRVPVPWQISTMSLKQSETRRRGDIGEGGMYI